MAIKKDELQALFKEFDRQYAVREAKAEAEKRILAEPRILHMDQMSEAVDKKKRIVLAYGMTGDITFSPAELRKFIKAYERTTHTFNDNKQGITILQIMTASRPVDIERGKTVKNATFYARMNNILCFQVSGNSKPYYKVEIRIEDWNKYVGSPMPAMAAVRNMLQGRISFECPCGRHQYWYRYIATIGNYAIMPLEYGFPKIRNKTLWGCCCKHVHKVLDELQSNKMLLLLTREVERERKGKGFGGNKRKAEILSPEMLRIAQAKRLSRDAAAAFRKYEQEARAIRKQLQPTPTKAAKVFKPVDLANVKNEIDRLKKLTHGKITLLDKDAAIKDIAKTTGLTVKRVNKIIEDNKLWQNH